MAADNSPDNPKDARNTYLIRVNLLLYKNPTIIYINDATCDLSKSHWNSLHLQKRPIFFIIDY